MFYINLYYKFNSIYETEEPLNIGKLPYDVYFIHLNAKNKVVNRIK